MTSTDLLDNQEPVNFQDDRYTALFKRLQGNILKGHGRDFTISIFLDLHGQGAALQRTLGWLTRKYVTSAYDQLVEREHFTRFRLPGLLFGNLFLTPGAYIKLGMESHLRDWFADDDGESRNTAAPFLRRMHGMAQEFGDRLVPAAEREPLEDAYVNRTIDAMLLLADDSRGYLLRKARALISRLEERGLATVVAVEIGDALRNEDEEGIEHFGFVDGRSQPLFLASDFRVDPGDRRVRFERVDDKAVRRESGRIDYWDPFAPLSLALVRDPAVEHPAACGSYYVFRKLEQDVLRFSIAEQQLADALHLEGEDRERAGAMMVGRFRDGTPLALSPTDGFVPAKANNFRYDDLDATLAPHGKDATDPYGLKCPFQAHIRKVNPRQNVRVAAPEESVSQLAMADRSRRIVRRGIAYGERRRAPNTFQALQDLPTRGVGLLFACFQGSIRRQFQFMQQRWANDINFMTRGNIENMTGLDAVIGQSTIETVVPQHWRAEYGGTLDYDRLVPHLPLGRTHTTNVAVSGFVRFRGGEFFFAPSLTFLLGG